MFRGKNPDQVSAGVFFIGLALLFVTGFWWPGVLFVVGASIMSKFVAQGKKWQDATPALVMFGIGLIFGLPDLLGFALGTLLPVSLIGIGAYLILSDTSSKKITASRKHKLTVDTSDSEFDHLTVEDTVDVDDDDVPTIHINME